MQASQSQITDNRSENNFTWRTISLPKDVTVIMSASGELVAKQLSYVSSAEAEY
jgi:hypothetical protein